MYLAWLRGTGNRERSTLVELIGIVALIAIIGISPKLPEAIRYSLYLVPARVALIAVMACGAGTISRSLNVPLFARLRQVSFALYLLHWSVIAALSGALWKNAAITFALMLGLTLAGRFAMYHAVEQPLRTRLRSALSAKAPSLVPAAGHT